MTTILKTKSKTYDLINKIETPLIVPPKISGMVLLFFSLKGSSSSLQWVGLRLAFQATPGRYGDV